MPIIFNEVTNAYEGENLSGTVLAGFDFSVFGGVISNSGTVTGAITAITDAGIEVSNDLRATITKAAGSAFAVDLQGNGGRNFFNDGTVIGNVAFGNGWDTMINSGLVQGRIITGAGNDLLVNQIIPGIDGGVTIGTVTGTVDMGDSNDTVVNRGVMGDVGLGAGDDRYSVVDLGAPGGGFDDIPVFGPPTGSGPGIAGDARGDAGNDNISGGDADDRFYGGADNDTLSGGNGKDQLYGDAGHDLIFGGNGNDNIFGGAGRDTIYGGDNNDRISGDGGKDLIFAGNGNDVVSGGFGRDFIAGDAGNDKLSGDGGNDTLEGGFGHDQLSGGTGADVFIFAGSTGRDLITDFGAGDLIEIYVDNAANVSYSDILANTQFSGGNAVIDLSSLYNLGDFGSGNDKGSILTIADVTIDDLDASSFAVLNNVFVIG